MMQGLKGQPLLLLVCLLLSFSTIITANTIAQTCRLVPNNTYIADSSNCADWFLCVDGLLKHWGQCINGKLYNAQTGQCTSAKDVTCASEYINSVCRDHNGVYKIDPTNCQRYCLCENGVATCSQCENGLVFNPNTLSCVPAPTYECVVSSPCALVPNNVPVKDVTSCSSYYQCLKGVGLKKTCSIGFLYNAVKGICDYSPNVDCRETTIPVPGSPKCANVSVEQPLVSDGATCQGYLNCTNGPSTVEPIRQECPEESHFSQSLQKCVSSFSVACPYDRCAGLTNTFVAAINSSCRDYHVCKNGATKLDSKAGCPAKFPYFHESRQSCVPNKPSYAVCS